MALHHPQYRSLGDRLEAHPKISQYTTDAPSYASSSISLANGGRRVAQWFVHYSGPLLSLAALLLWLQSLSNIQLETINDLGLISVFPPAAFVALAILCFSFFTLLYQQHFEPATLALHFAVLIFMLYGVTALIQEMPRFHVSWRHIGIADYILRHGDVDPMINAYFNWPGFFVLTAFLVEVTGVKDPTALTAYAPLFFSLLYLGPLHMIFSATSRDPRLVWLALWFFFITNWVFQDYFSPQALNYFFYLVILGVLLRWFRATDVRLNYVPQRWQAVRPLQNLVEWVGWRFRIDRPATVESVVASEAISPDEQRRTQRQRMGLLIVLLVVFASIVPSHQLTPFFTIMAVVSLVLLNRCTTRDLPVLMSVLTALWIVFMTTAYLAGHIGGLISDVGNVDANVSVNLTERFQGSAQHLFVVRVRLIMTVAIYIIGALGALRRLRRGNLDLIYAVLALAPFALVVVQPYGGEMILRAYLFALPATAFLAAAFFYPEASGYNPWQPIVGVVAVTLLLGAGFLFARYGNERMDYYTPAEVAAVDAVYDMATPGSLFVTSSDNLPWKHRDLELHRYRTATPATQRRDTDRIIEIMTERQYAEAYYISTRAQYAYSELFLGEPPGTWAAFVQMLLKTGRFEQVYQNEDATVLRFLSESKATAKPVSQPINPPTEQVELGVQTHLLSPAQAGH